jgi:hypothetical protein
MSANNKEFDRILMDSIDESLSKLFGQNEARSVGFYIDPNLAAADPTNYARSLEKMFGEGAKLILDTIIDNLSQKVGVMKNNSKGFGEEVVMMKVSFNQTGRQ